MPESKSMMEQLCRLVGAGNAALLGGGAAPRLGEIVRVLVQALAIEDAGLASLRPMIGALLKQIGAQIVPETRQAIGTALGESERSVLASMWA
jgi:hypothetical protein|tara:strand:+ start:3518 stop:3796 length:279 start_codon:yes stop_codon:yes gene_type:complete